MITPYRRFPRTATVPRTGDARTILCIVEATVPSSTDALHSVRTVRSRYVPPPPKRLSHNLAHRGKPRQQSFRGRNRQRPRPRVNPHVLLPDTKPLRTVGPSWHSIVTGDDTAYFLVKAEFGSFDQAHRMCETANAGIGWIREDTNLALSAIIPRQSDRLQCRMFRQTS